MKNILTTAGLAAVAVAGFQATSTAQTVTVDNSKWWQVYASLRGFYDDNYTIAPDEFARESFGFEIRPGFSVGHQSEQTTLKLDGFYTGRWFEDRDDEPWDHGFMADANGEHRLSENHILRLNDNFSYSSEPTLLDRGGPITLLRADGTNMRNLGDLRYIGQMTPLFGLEIGYQNTWYDFESEGVGSYSSILDRLEHLFRAETRWTLTPTLAGILGYWYEMVDFTDDEFIGVGSPFKSDVRNSNSHYIVTGVDYTVSPHCFVSVRGGSRLSVRTFERGVEAETLSCGSGVVAAEVVAGAERGQTPPVSVATRAGSALVVDFRLEGSLAHDVTLTGDARLVFEGLLKEEAL